MEKINFPSEREQEFRPFKPLFFQDEYNSEMPIFDDEVDPVDYEKFHDDENIENV